MCSANEDGTFKYKLKSVLKEDQGKDLQTTRKITLLKFNLVIGRNRVLEYKECLSLITLSNLLPEYLKYHAISHSQNSEKTTQPYATPGETSDTGFSETLEQNTDTHTHQIEQKVQKLMKEVKKRKHVLGLWPKKVLSSVPH